MTALKVLLHGHQKAPPATELAKTYGDGTYAFLRNAAGVHIGSVQQVKDGIVVMNEELPATSLGDNLVLLADWLDKGLKIKAVLYNGTDSNSVTKALARQKVRPLCDIERIDLA